MNSIRLTSLSHDAGCACQLGLAEKDAAELQRQLVLEGTLEQAIMGRCLAGTAGANRVVSSR